MSFLASSIFLLLSGLHTVVSAYSGPESFARETSPLKAIVFLSASCPCSQSHVEHLNSLVKTYPSLKIFGVITDDLRSSSKQKIQEYYSPERFQFPVIEDLDQTLVKKHRALKTPHVVLFKKQSAGDYHVIYEGGVSDRRQFAKSKKKFLQENLVALKTDQPLPYSKGQSLGCYIRRF